MSRCESLTIYLKESGKSYNFKYCYNDNSTFEDLLESFSYNYSDLKICPCYKIEYYNKYNYKYVKLDMKEKVNNYMNYYYKFQLFKENNECTCDEFIKDYFREPKLKIIKKLNEYSKEVNNLKNEIKENKSMNNKLFKQLENQNQTFSQLQNNYKELQKKMKILKMKNLL